MDNLDKMKVTELKAALAERGLDTKGNKAALVERLGAAINDDNNDNFNDNDYNESNDASRDQDHTSAANGAELYNPEEETPSSPDDNDRDENGENGADDAGFEGHEFVKTKPTGISFGLHQPTKVKPQPNELKPLTDDTESVSDQSVARQGAASFFSGHQTGDTAGQEADVPLPPTTSFMEESEDEEEEGPPGLGDVQLPTDVFNKVTIINLSY